MTKQEIAERYCLDDNTIFIEPEDEFNGGIIGVSEDRQHVIYDYDKTVETAVNQNTIMTMPESGSSIIPFAHCRTRIKTLFQ